MRFSLASGIALSAVLAFVAGKPSRLSGATVLSDGTFSNANWTLVSTQLPGNGGSNTAVTGTRARRGAVERRGRGSRPARPPQPGP